VRVRVLQHVPFEGPAALAPALRAAGHDVAITRLDAGEPLPPLAALDWLVVLGGPMSVHDEAEHAWLAPEKRLIREAVADGRRVLGICLGAQLIAAALGARVTRCREREIGWFPVERAPGAEASPFGRALPARFPAFHWHGEAFAPPPGAVRLASSAACAEQAFALGDLVLGLQLHVETTREAAEALVAHCADELVPGPWVQDAAAILAEDAPFAEAQRVLRALLAVFEGAERLPPPPR
jgi:GMP synthase-like glutamine amidotransferase